MHLRWRRILPLVRVRAGSISSHRPIRLKRRTSSRWKGGPRPATTESIRALSSRNGPSETSARSAVITAVGTYANAGFTVTAAEEAFLGPGQRGGTYLKQATNAYIHVWTKQRGGGLVATRLSGSDPIEIAHVLIGDDVNAKGGGGGVQAQSRLAVQPIEGGGHPEI